MSYSVGIAVAEGDDISVLYDLRFNKPPVTIIGCGWYHVIGKKIDSIKVIYDPRPILPQQKYKRPVKAEPHVAANRKITG